MNARPSNSVLLVIALFAIVDLACAPVRARSVTYGVDLTECNRKATTCEESIACENVIRAKENRPLRTGGCK